MLKALIGMFVFAVVFMIAFTLMLENKQKPR